MSVPSPTATLVCLCIQFNLSILRDLPPPPATPTHFIRGVQGHPCLLPRWNGSIFGEPRESSGQKNKGVGWAGLAMEEPVQDESQDPPEEGKDEEKREEAPLVPPAGHRRPLARSTSTETLCGDREAMENIEEETRLKVPLKDRHQLESQDSEADRKVLRSDDPAAKILWAAEKNALELTKQLLEADSSLVHVTDSDRYTPLHRACYANNAEVARVLLSHGASLSARTVDDWEPLHCACKWGSVECALALLQSGANANAVSVGGLTPVHLAAANPSGRHVLELLLWNPYTDVNAVSGAGDKPYDVARRHVPHADLFDLVSESVNVF